MKETNVLSYMSGELPNFKKDTKKRFGVVEEKAKELNKNEGSKKSKK